MDTDYTRRGFLTGTAAAGATALACAAGAGTVSQAAADETGGVQFDSQTDVLVLGAGAAGCYAACFALQQGASVTLVEAASHVGGTAVLSGGYYHTWDITPENVDEKLASADPHKRALFIERWQQVRDWTLDHPELGASELDFDYPLYGAHLIGFATGGSEMADGRRKFLEDVAAGAEVILDTYFVDLIADETGAILGALVQGKDGTRTRIGAKATVIATGSFQNNRELIEQHLGRWADNAICRATTYNKGAGILAALRHGARMGFGTGHFYGHLNPWPSLTPRTEEEYEAADPNNSGSIMGAVQTFSVEGIAVNRNGLRYTDEGPENYVGDNYLANDSMQEADGHIFVIIDSHEDHAAKLQLIEDAGGVVVSADTVDELAEKLSAYKVNAHNLKKTVEEYQAAAAAGTTMELEIPKTPMPTGYLTKLDTPPFYAVQAAAGISGFYGGIEVDDDCAVYGAGDQLIPNLYAAPMASGGYFYKEYGGGLALCATFGAVAGEAAGKHAMA